MSKLARFLLLIAIMMGACHVYAAVLNVTSKADSGAGTLRQAIADAADGDTINFSLGAGNETIVISSQLSILGKSLTINGANTGSNGVPVTVQVTDPGTSTWRVFHISVAGKTINISNMTIKGGNIDGAFDINNYGGSICHRAGTLNLDRATISGSKARYGGGIYATNNLNIANCTINGATAGLGGGVYFDAANLTVNNSTIQGNTAAGGVSGLGGGFFFHSQASVAILNSTISGNATSDAGGGIECQPGGKVCLANTIVINNTAGSAADIRGNNAARVHYSWYGQASDIITNATAPNVTVAYTVGDLAALADNGGPTRTMALSNAAPAYQAGQFVYYNSSDGAYIQANDSTYRKMDGSYTEFVPADPASDKITLDQRGETRAAPVSMGAYQAATPVMSFLGTNGAAIASGAAASIEKGTDFGGVAWGSALTNTFSITNSGGAALTISGLTTNGSGAAAFTLAGIPGTINAGAASNFTVVFAPLNPGTYTAAVHIANDSTTTPYIVYLAGEVAKQDQTITFGAIADQHVNAAVGLAATASSGLEVSFAVGAGPGTIAGGTNLSFTGTGAVSIVASQAGDANWNAAPSITNTFNVTGCQPEPGSGSLSITLNREEGTWTLSGPAEYTGATNGTGSLAATSVPTGSYTVSYGHLAGYRRPAEQTKEVTEGGSSEFTGEYIVGQTPVDFGGEGVSDLAVYNPLTGRWYIWSPETGVIAWETTLGGPGFSPIPGDYNGDGRVDFAVYSDGFWYAQTLGGTSILDGVAFGGADFSPVAGDYDGDGITDMMVYHEGAGRWYGRTVAGALLMWGTQWGGPGFSAVAGDYNNNGRTDLAVYANGYWFIKTADGDEIILYGQGWGGDEFTPVPGEYDGDGETDLAVYHEASGMWFIIKLDGTLIAWGVQWGGPGFKAVTGDYNGDGISDLAVYYNGYWFVKGVDGTIIFYGEQWGAEGFEPVGR